MPLFLCLFKELSAGSLLIILKTWQAVKFSVNQHTPKLKLYFKFKAFNLAPQIFSPKY